MRTLPADRDDAPDEARDDTLTDKDYGLDAVDRLCAILDLLRHSGPGIDLIAVAEAAEMPVSTADRYVRTLELQGFVERDDLTGVCRLGPALLRMRSHHVGSLRDFARPWMEKLRDESGETIKLGVLDMDRVVCADAVASPRGVRVVAIRGDRQPVHSTALGKAIAAELDEDMICELLRRSGMPKRSPYTITSIEDFLIELETVRSLGYAVDDQENDAEGRCVAVALPGANIPAAISLSAPAARMPAAELGRAAVPLLDAAPRIMGRK